MGGEFRDGRVDEFYHRRSLGSFIFDGTQGPWAGTCASSDPPVLWLTTWPAMWTIPRLRWEIRSATSRSNGFSFFGQDTWRVTPNFTLDLGLRYEYFGPLHNNDQATWRSSFQGRASRSRELASVPSFPADQNNFAPRIGFAWQPIGIG